MKMFYTDEQNDILLQMIFSIYYLSSNEAKYWLAIGRLSSL